MTPKPFIVIAGGEHATAIRHDKNMPRSMKIRQRKKGLNARRCSL